MRVPAHWSDTITLYHCDLRDGKAKWTKQVLSGCFLQIKPARQQVDMSWRDGVDGVCRIPAPAPNIALGDIIVRGNCADEIDDSVSGQNAADLVERNRLNALRVTEIHDNTRAHIAMPHVYIGGN